MVRLVKRNSLAQGLVAGPGRLAMPRAGAQGVAMPQALPPATRFGSLNPSITTGNRYSGGVVPGAMNMVHPEQPQTFQQPTYAAPSMGSAPAPSHALAPIIAALMSTGAGAPTTRTSTGTGGTTPAPSSWTGTGYISSLPPTPNLGPAGPTLPTNTASGQSALLAALGKKLNPSSPGGGSYVKSY
jgi:hypothetical protein